MDTKNIIYNKPKGKSAYVMLKSDQVVNEDFKGADVRQDLS